MIEVPRALPTEGFLDDEDEPTTQSLVTQTQSLLTLVREAGPGGRILLVEDGEDNRRLISATLERAGFEITQAENGEEGLQTALRARDDGEPFGVIIMDMQMPVMDGYQATKLLRGAGYDGPIVALTAHAMKGDRERCIRAGCDDFGTKPLNHRQLLSTILTLLRKSKERSV